MNRIDPKRATRFIAIFASIAVFISYLSDYRQGFSLSSDYPRYEPHDRTVSESSAVNVRRTEQIEAEERARTRRMEEERQRESQLAARQAAETAERNRQEAASAHARFLARYLNSDVTRTPGTKAVAFMVVSENGKFNRALSTALMERFKGEPVQFLSSFFKPEFFSDGLFNSAFSDPTEVLKKLELSKSVDAVLLARQRVRYSTSSSLENLITASMELDVTVFPTDANAEPRTWTFNAPGPGFKQADARSMAEERIIKQITKDTKMSLTTLFTKN